MITKYRLVLIINIFLLSVFILTPEVFAYVSSSNNYRLEKDSINFGGLDSSSGNYRLADTAGEIGSGDSSSATYAIRAGYQAMETGDTYITLSAPSDVTLSSIASDTGGQSSGTASWTVTTNNSSGYSLSVKASTNPALKSGSNSFADYTPSGASPDFNWSVGTSASEFGFTPEGSHISSTFKDNGSSCNTGSTDTSASCWQAFTTTDQTISSSNSSTPSGTATTIRFRAEIGADATIADGSYSSTITVTAVTL